MLAVLAGSGLVLAGFAGVFSGTASASFYTIFAVKVALVVALVAGAFVHDFVLGRGLPARSVTGVRRRCGGRSSSSAGATSR